MRARVAAAVALWLLVTPSLPAQRPKRLKSDRSSDIKKARLAGTDLSYIDSGRGVPVVLIHGSASDYRIWRSQIRPFAAKYRVIAYSRRYHTPNAWRGDGSDYAATLHAEDLVELLQSLKLGPAHLVGHSAGGTIALLVARDHPELVRSVVVMEPGLPSLLTREEGEVARAAREHALSAAKAAMAAGEDERAIQFLMDWVLRPRTYRGVSPPMKAMLLDHARLLKVLLSSPPPPPDFTCEHAGALKTPMLLVEGAASVDYMVAPSRALHQCQPSAQRVAIPQATHNMQLDNPHAFNRAVLEFLERQ